MRKREPRLLVLVFSSSSFFILLLLTSFARSFGPTVRTASPFSKRSLAFRLLATAKATSKKSSSKKKMAPSSRQQQQQGEEDAVLHMPVSLLPQGYKKERTRILTKEVQEPNPDGTSVVYWMQRDVRTEDNWALHLASHLAHAHEVPLHVVYALPPPPEPQADDDALPPTLEQQVMTQRHGTFLLGGLACVHEELHAKQIPLHMVQPDSHQVVGETVCRLLLDTLSPKAVVCDFSPLRQPRTWMQDEAAPRLQQASTPLYQVDAHNIVPVWIASPKREVGARTLRPKIQKVLSGYLQKCPKLDTNVQTKKSVTLPAFSRDTYESYLQMDAAVPALDWATPGTAAAKKQFQYFCDHGLKDFDALRNNPNHKNVCSHLSPWINHGHISFARLCLATKKLNKYATGTASFLEEGVIRRELSDNFLFYAAEDYDSLSTAAGWAQETLRVHTSDPREYLYSFQELEQAQTHDDLWNAAQLQVVREGRMHGFLRMYWAKKILEWTESPDVALRTAQYFNDRYALDGKDPNGFVGVGWSIMGIHDMGWKEREIFGKIRYMNYAGCKRKFKVPTVVAMYEGAAENAAKATKKHAKNSSSNDSSKRKQDGKEASQSDKKQKKAAAKK